MRSSAHLNAPPRAAQAASDGAIATVSCLFVLKILAFIWVCVFVYSTVTTFFQKDEKFGRYCWSIALISGVLNSTVLPIMLIFDVIKNPKAPFSRLRHGRRRKKQ